MPTTLLLSTPNALEIDILDDPVNFNIKVNSTILQLKKQIVNRTSNA